MGRGKKQIHNRKQVLEYWDRPDVESMYDKHLLNLEVELIKRNIPKNSKVLDAGCGEGEGTLAYSSIPGAKIHAVDFSETRLALAAKRLRRRKNVILKKADFLHKYSLDKDYDIIVSQRFLINLMEWKLQKKVLLDLKSMLKKNGKLIMLEGSLEGVRSLNKLREVFGLESIPVKWHNLFFEDEKFIKFMETNRMKLVAYDGLGEYFVFTRGIRPFFDQNLNWDSKFNEFASSLTLKKLLKLGPTCSRLKLWVFKKE